MGAPSPSQTKRDQGARAKEGERERALYDAARTFITTTNQSLNLRFAKDGAHSELLQHRRNEDETDQYG